MNKLNEYREFVKEYFKEYQRLLCWRKVLVAFAVLMYSLRPWEEGFHFYRYISGFPVFLAFVSGIFHHVSLPMMMYIMPYTNQMREDYIQKLLKVKVGIPMVVAVMFDVVVFAINPMQIKAIILQLLMVYLLTYIMGMIYDGQSLQYEERSAFGTNNAFINFALWICYTGSVIMSILCGPNINNIEFGITFAVILLFYVPTARKISKQWKEIRANFAKYERITEAREREVR